MKNSTALLGAALGVSLLINVLAWTRLSRQENPAPRTRGNSAAAEKPLAETTAGLSSDAKLDRMIQEMDRLRSEVAALRESRTGAPSSKESRPAPTAETAAAHKDPRMAELMREGDAVGEYWKNLETLFNARESAKEGEYQHWVLEATADFLGLADPARAQFIEMARVASRNMEAAGREYAEAAKGLKYDPSNPQAYNDATQQIYQRYLDQEKVAQDQIDAGLSQDNPRHKVFIKNFQTFAYYLNPTATAAVGGVWNFSTGDR